MERAYLSLGSNIGDRAAYLSRAIELLNNNTSIQVTKISSFYETEPQGYTDQSDFINCAVLIETDLQPFDLLIFCQEIERKLKRKRLFRWGPRTIDVDILTYGNIIINSDELTIPHERMYERAFVMAPLAEIDNSYIKYLKKLENQKVRKADV